MLTPLDIENKKFPKSIKGYNVDDVDDFLDELTVQYEKLYKENKIEAMKLADEIIKNTYRILLTRGGKGCAIFCVDKNLNEYIKKLLKKYK